MRKLKLIEHISLDGVIQYDTDNDSVGINTRLRWTFTSAGDLFVVYNHNVRQLLDRWQLEANQLLVQVSVRLLLLIKVGVASHRSSL